MDNYLTKLNSLLFNIKMCSLENCSLLNFKYGLTSLVIPLRCSNELCYFFPRHILFFLCLIKEHTLKSVIRHAVMARCQPYSVSGLCSDSTFPLFLPLFIQALRYQVDMAMQGCDLFNKRM